MAWKTKIKYPGFMPKAMITQKDQLNSISSLCRKKRWWQKDQHTETRNELSGEENLKKLIPNKSLKLIQKMFFHSLWKRELWKFFFCPYPTLIFQTKLGISSLDKLWLASRKSVLHFYCIEFFSSFHIYSTPMLNW